MSLPHLDPSRLKSTVIGPTDEATTDADDNTILGTQQDNLVPTMLGLIDEFKDTHYRSDETLEQNSQRMHDLLESYENVTNQVEEELKRHDHIVNTLHDLRRQKKSALKRYDALPAYHGGYLDYSIKTPGLPELIEQRTTLLSTMINLRCRVARLRYDVDSTYQQNMAARNRLEKRVRAVQESFRVWRGNIDLSARFADDSKENPDCERLFKEADRAMSSLHTANFWAGRAFENTAKQFRPPRR
jgi:CHAD domain-containing protein